MNPKINKIFPLKFFEPFISVVFWILLLASPLLFKKFEQDFEWQHIFRVWISFLPYMALYLLNRFVFLPFFFFRSLRWQYFLSNTILIIALASFFNLYKPDVFMPFGQKKPTEIMPIHGDPRPGPGSGELPPRLRENLPPLRSGERLPPVQSPPKQLPPFLSFIVVSILIIGFDTGLIISVKWTQSEQKRVRAEKESVESQLVFLQNQISPHFFMNTLNNIHALIDIDTNEAKESIIKLSKLMRHMLYDSQVERISLKKEIEFIQNYVELMRLRFSQKVKITLHIPDQISNKTIPPLLVTSFVENAFKHGISFQSLSFIDIHFSEEPKQLSFIIRNSNPGIIKDEGPSGIGIENSRKRLDLIYGSSYTLEISENASDFIVNLKIPV